ncbi:MAG: Ger(x)C family spore germination protein [Candidatus Contubernalis sp.]|nr:Ger(x)C family spore germination protein [Candidatus Contubernalis sp.]
MKRKYAVIILILSMLFNSGCWNRVEPEEIALIMMVGFERDEEGDGLKIFVQSANPPKVGSSEEGGGGSQGESTWAASATGRTVTEALNNLAKKSTRLVDLSHMGIVLFSEDLAREGIAPLMDFFDRERQSRLITQPMVVEGDLQRVMEADFVTEETAASALTRLHVVAREELAVSLEIPFRVILNRLSQPGWEIVMPRLREVEPQEGEPPPETPMEIDGLAVFKKDRMMGWLNSAETRGYNWIVGRITRPIYVFESPTRQGEEISVQVHQSSTRLEAVTRGEEVAVIVNAVVEGRIEETTSDEEFLSAQSELIDSMNRRLGQAVRNDIQAALKKSQKEFESDIFGFGNLIYRTRFQEWEKLENRWDEIFPDLQVEVYVKAEVRRSGLVKDPLIIR